MANEKREKKIPTGVKRKSLILGTAILLATAFIILIALFILMTSLLPSFTGQCVAVVDLNMPLSVEGQPMTLFETGYPGSAEIANYIEQLDEREDVGSVLFIVNSGGGSVVASDEIYNAVKGVEKPKVAYFREVAASGAYYVSSGTDYIISEPNALTGNIGVVAMVISMGGLFDKLGINATAITSGDHKDIGSPYRNMSEEEYQIMQSIVDEIFEEFRNVVIENRGNKLNMPRFNEITDGRIMTGRQALEVGLVDEVGNMDYALMKAAELGGIEAESPADVRVCYVEMIPQEGGLFSAESFIGSITEKFQTATLRYQ